MRLKALLGAAVLSAAGLMVTGLSQAAKSEVNAEHHKLCSEAKDYAGCIRAMKGDTSSRTINSQGADIAEGNQCPAGYAYLGSGNCQDVRCQFGAGTSLGHDSLVAGLKDKQGKDVWGCQNSFWYGRGVLRLKGAVTRTSNNPSCPVGEPKIGYNSSCQTAAAGGKADWLSGSEEDLGDEYIFSE